jgi:DNA-binding helix-hairpin-helix protein with protein kinase domain
VEDYNAEWRVEKNGFVSPRPARQAWFAALSQLKCAIKNLLSVPKIGR